MTPQEANAEADLIAGRPTGETLGIYDLTKASEAPITDLVPGDYVTSVTATGFILSINRGIATVLERSMYFPTGKEKRVAVKHLLMCVTWRLRKKNNTIPR